MWQIYENMNYKLYILICPIDNCVRYVGITSKSLKERLKIHIRNRNRKKNYYKENWIQKLKKQNLKPQIKLVADKLSKEKACQMEIDLIALYRSIVGKKLTNIHEGGNVPPKAPMTGKKHSAKTITKMRKAALGRKFSPEHIKKLSIINSHPLSREHKKKISFSLLNGKHPIAKIVYQIDIKTNEIINQFHSITQAAKSLNTSRYYIADVCRKEKNFKGFKWRFKK